MILTLFELTFFVQIGMKADTTSGDDENEEAEIIPKWYTIAIFI